MGAMTSRIAKAQQSSVNDYIDSLVSENVQGNNAIVNVQRELINASDFNSVDEYRAAVKAQRAAIEAHNASIRSMGR